MRKISSNQSVRVTFPQGYRAGFAALGSVFPGAFSIALAHTLLYCSAVSTLGRRETCSNPIETLTSTFTFPLRARFVVIKTTPLDPTDAP